MARIQRKEAGAGRAARVENPRRTLMKSLPKPTHLEIEIDEWQAAQGDTEAVNVRVSWRGASRDPTIAPMLAALPSTSGYVPIKLADGRTEMAPRVWKSLRFGKGRPIYELARKNFEAWAHDRYFERARESDTVEMIRRLVPNFDDYPIEKQIDFIDRTQRKIDRVRECADDLVNHLEYAAPDKGKAVPPLENPDLKVRAAVFSALMNSRRVGELLGVPQKNTERYENQTVRRMADIGRWLLRRYYGAVELDAKISRMQKYHQWWARLNSNAPKQQMYILLAKAQDTSVELQRSRAEEDGFDEKLTEWIDVVERRLEADETYSLSEDSTLKENAQRTANRLVSRQMEIEETDGRFREALSAIESPPTVA